MLITEDQVTTLMDLLKIPVEKRNFVEFRDRIQNLLKENESLTVQIQSKNDEDIQTKAEMSPLEKILNKPGLVHLAENIFGNLADEDLEVCRNINQTSKEILDNPMFWLRKFESLSKENQTDWIKVIQSVKNSEKEKAIISYLQWNLKKETLVDFPCFTSPDVQDDFKKRIMEICEKGTSSDEDIEIVKILAPLTENPNAPNSWGLTPIHWAAFWGHTENVKILAPLTDNPNAPDGIFGKTPIYLAALKGHTEIVKILAPNNPNAPDKYGITPIYLAASCGHTEIVKSLAPLTDNPNVPNKDGRTPIYLAARFGHTEFVKILAPLTDNPNAPDNYGRTPIYIAAWIGYTEVVKFLAPLT